MSPFENLSGAKTKKHGRIVADFLIPVLTGSPLHAELQKSETETPIIVVTGHADGRNCRTRRTRVCLISLKSAATHMTFWL